MIAAEQGPVEWFVTNVFGEAPDAPLPVTPADPEHFTAPGSQLIADLMTVAGYVLQVLWVVVFIAILLKLVLWAARMQAGTRVSLPAAQVTARAVDAGRPAVSLVKAAPAATLEQLVEIDRVADTLSTLAPDVRAAIEAADVAARAPVLGANDIACLRALSGAKWSCLTLPSGRPITREEADAALAAL